MKLTAEDIEEYRLAVVKGANPGSKISFKPDVKVIRIGRAVDNDVVISDGSVSRQHARIELRDGEPWIVDAGSSGGVEKMGFRLAGPERLQSGDEFRIGDTILRFEVVAKKGALKKAAAREAAGADSAKPAAASPVQKALGRYGLGSPVRLAGAGVLCLVVAAVALWPAAPGLPPQASETPLAVNYNATVGFLDVDPTHLDKAIFDVPTDSEGMALTFRVFAPKGIRISGGSRAIATLEGRGGWRNHILLMIPRSFATGGHAEITFDNLGYAPSDGDIDPSTAGNWALQRMWLLRLVPAAATPDQLVESLSALGKLNERLNDNLGNRYLLISGLRTSALALMKLSGRGTVLLAVPSTVDPKTISYAEPLARARAELEAGNPDKSLEAVQSMLILGEADLEREYRNQMNRLDLARKDGDVRLAGDSLAKLTKIFPDAADPRSRSVLDIVRGLSPAARTAFDDALEALNIGAGA